MRVDKEGNHNDSPNDGQHRVNTVSSSWEKHSHLVQSKEYIDIQVYCYTHVKEALDKKLDAVRIEFSNWVFNISSYSDHSAVIVIWEVSHNPADKAEKEHSDQYDEFHDEVWAWLKKHYHSIDAIEIKGIVKRSCIHKFEVSLKGTLSIEDIHSGKLNKNFKEKF